MNPVIQMCRRKMQFGNSQALVCWKWIKPRRLWEIGSACIGYLAELQTCIWTSSTRIKENLGWMSRMIYESPQPALEIFKRGGPLFLILFHSRSHRGAHPEYFLLSPVMPSRPAPRSHPAAGMGVSKPSPVSEFLAVTRP